MNEITEEEYYDFLKGISTIVDDRDVYHDIAGNFSHRYVVIKNGKRWQIECGRLGGKITYYSPELRRNNCL